MNLDTINKAKFALHQTQPIEGRLLAELIGASIEECYSALVWLYDRQLALISRQEKTGRINGWIRAA